MEYKLLKEVLQIISRDHLYFSLFPLSFADTGWFEHFGSNERFDSSWICLHCCSKSFSLILPIGFAQTPLSSDIFLRDSSQGWAGSLYVFTGFSVQREPQVYFKQ